MHCLAKALLHSAQIPMEHIKVIETYLDPEMADAIKQIKNKASYFCKKIDSKFIEDKLAKEYMEGDFNLTDEMAMQVIEAVEKIIKTPKNQILS